MYVTINNIKGEKRIDLFYSIQNFDSDKEIAVIRMLSDNVQYQILKLHAVMDLISDAKKTGSRTKSPWTKPPRTKSPDKIPLDKIPHRTKSPQTKSPWTKSPHYIPPNCSIAQYFLLFINVIFEGQFSSTFVRCDISMVMKWRSIAEHSR